MCGATVRLSGHYTFDAKENPTDRIRFRHPSNQRSLPASNPWRLVGRQQGSIWPKLTVNCPSVCQLGN